MPILEVANLKKTYTTRFGGNQVQALQNVSFSVEAGEYVAIMGESGSGKTTLLNILAALDKPTGGTVMLDGRELSKIKESEIAKFRRDNLGFVFQEFNLLDTFSVQDNIFLPLVLAGKSFKEMKQRLDPIAHKLMIYDLLNKYPYEISGGQKQRAAVARALITEPRLILADEPTGALDSKSTDELLELFSAINHDGQTILMVTHSVKAASHASRVLFIKDGMVYHQIYRGNNFRAGELGHFTIDIHGEKCECGLYGCYEHYASAKALVKMTLRAAKAAPDSLLANYSKSGLDGKTAFTAAAAGCPIAREVLSEYGRMLSVGINSILKVFRPDIIVLSGSIAREGKTLLDYISPWLLPDAVVKTTLLDGDGGLIGASLLAKPYNDYI